VALAAFLVALAFNLAAIFGQTAGDPTASLKPGRLPQIGNRLK